MQRKPLLKFQIMDAICSPSCKLRPALRHLLLVMAHLADGHTGSGYTSQANLAKAMGMKERAVRKLLAELENEPDSPVKVVRRYRPRPDGRGRSSDVYVLQLTGTVVPVEGEAEGADQPAQDDRPTGTDETTNRHDGTGDQVRDQVSDKVCIVAPTKAANGSQGKRGKPKPKRQKARPWPADFKPTKAHEAFAAKHDLDLDLEVAACTGHHDGKLVVSPNGALSKWMANSAKWKKEAAAKGASGPRRGVVAVQRGGLQDDVLDRARAAGDALTR